MEESVAHACIAKKDSNFRWLSFIGGNAYFVRQIKYSNGEVDQTHVSVEGVFRYGDGKTEMRKIPVAKTLCKEFLNPQKDESHTEGEAE